MQEVVAISSRKTVRVEIFHSGCQTDESDYIISACEGTKKKKWLGGFWNGNGTDTSGQGGMETPQRGGAGVHKRNFEFSRAKVGQSRDLVYGVCMVGCRLAE